MNNDYLNQLNPQQRAAVEYCDGPQLVIAGAGSGKTRVLTYKIVHLLNLGIKPYRIMALTFTNKAAREMRERIATLVQPEIAAQLWMGTFHSIFARLLRSNADRIGYTHNYTIYDQSDSRSLVKIIINDVLKLDDKTYRPSDIQNLISSMKNALILPDQYNTTPQYVVADRDAGRPCTGEIYRLYCERCRVADAMDFDDLLVNTNLMFRNNPDILERYQEMFQYILVDEYQDTNFAQHAIVLQLTEKHSRLCVVGDDAQSIYSFRGANVNNILQLKRFYPTLETFKLERNYRSTKMIIGAANSLIAHNSKQIPKNLFSENPKGSPIEIVSCITSFSEAYFVAQRIQAIRARQGSRYLDFAVLYRTNAQSRLFEEAFSRGGQRDSHGHTHAAIPYRIYGGLSFYQRKEIKDIIAYMRLVVNTSDDEALRRIINVPARGIGATTIQRIQDAAMQGNTSMWHVLNNLEASGVNINRGIQAKVQSFIDLINSLRELNDNKESAEKLVTEIITRSRILSVIKADRTPENISREENIKELVSAVNVFVATRAEDSNDNMLLADFLAQVSLMTDQDRENEKASDYVTLMTVHSAKGLEFRNVIIVGMEKDLFPSALSSDSLPGIEEERRLFYVAITRAEETCLITTCKQRMINGAMRFTSPSMFLSEIDSQFVRVDKSLADDNDFATPSGATTSFRIRRQSDFTQMPPARRDSGISTPPPSRPVNRPSSSSGTQSSVSAGEFTRLKAAQLHPGDTIIHKSLGRATVLEVNDEADPYIIANFDGAGIKKLLLKFAFLKIV